MRCHETDLCVLLEGEGPHPAFSESGLMSPSPLSLPLLLFGYRLEVTQTTPTQLFQNTFFCLLNQVGRLGVTCNSLCVVIPLHPLPLEAVWASAGAAAAPSLGSLFPPLHPAPLLTVLGQFLISHQCNIFP